MRITWNRRPLALPRSLRPSRSEIRSSCGSAEAFFDLRRPGSFEQGHEADDAVLRTAARRSRSRRGRTRGTCRRPTPARPSMLAMTRTGMRLQVLDRGVDHVTVAGSSATVFRNRPRVDGSSFLDVLRREHRQQHAPRAPAWNGGSDEIGGAIPSGASPSIGGRWSVMMIAARGEVLGVVFATADTVLVPCGQPRPAVAVGVGHRARAAQVAPDGEGIGRPALVGVIEVGGPVLDRGMAAGHVGASVGAVLSQGTAVNDHREGADGRPSRRPRHASWPRRACRGCWTRARWPSWAR